MELNEISGEIVQAAIKVHSALGPGLLESAYRACLCHELYKCGLRSEVEVVLPLKYDGVTIDAGYRLDLLVEDAVIVELKTVRELLPVHQAQLLSYLRLGNRRLGLLINSMFTDCSTELNGWCCEHPSAQRSASRIVNVSEVPVFSVFPVVQGVSWLSSGFEFPPLGVNLALLLAHYLYWLNPHRSASWDNGRGDGRENQDCWRNRKDSEVVDRDAVDKSCHDS